MYSYIVCIKIKNSKKITGHYIARSILRVLQAPESGFTMDELDRGDMVIDDKSFSTQALKDAWMNGEITDNDYYLIRQDKVVCLKYLIEDI
jgi:hypothetical protein